MTIVELNFLYCIYDLNLEEKYPNNCKQTTKSDLIILGSHATIKSDKVVVNIEAFNIFYI